MGKIIHISTYKGYQTITNNYPNKHILIYFYSDDCDTCQTLKPLLNEFIQDEFNDNIIFLKVDVDKSKEIINKLDITTYPVFRLYKNDIELKEIFGTYNNIKEILKEIFTT